MAIEPVVMPQLGESVAEATLSRWHVKEGDQIERDQTIAEASTDKADTELPSPLSGRLVRILVQEGQTVPVNTPIAEIDTAVGAGVGKSVAPGALPGAEPGAQPPAGARPAREAPATAAEHEPPAKPTGPAPGREPAAAGGAPPAREPAAAKAAPSPAPAVSAATPAARVAPPVARERAGEAQREPAAPARPSAAQRPEAAEEAEAERRRSSPLVRRMARELNIDLSRIEGSGANGRVTKQDVLHFVESGEGRSEGEGEAVARERPLPPIRAPQETRPSPREVAVAGPTPAPAPAAARARPAAEYRPPEYRPMPGDEVVPFTRRRQLIAGHMVYSKQTSPHVACMAEIDLHRVARLRREAKSGGEVPSFLAYVCAAAVRAVRDYPIVNASVLADAYVLHKVVNLGVAVDTEEGLVVPVVSRADERSLVGISRAIGELAEKARAKKLSADDLAGGTLTVSNPGVRGNVWGMAIINQPQVIILRMGEIVKRPVVVSHDGEDAIVIRPIMNLVLSYDHRIIDGVAANGYLRRVKELLETEPQAL